MKNRLWTISIIGVIAVLFVLNLNMVWKVESLESQLHEQGERICDNYNDLKKRTMMHKSVMKKLGDSCGYWYYTADVPVGDGLSLLMDHLGLMFSPTERPTKDWKIEDDPYK